MGGGGDGLRSKFAVSRFFDSLSSLGGTPAERAVTYEGSMHLAEDAKVAARTQNKVAPCSSSSFLPMCKPPLCCLRQGSRL